MNIETESPRFLVAVLLTIFFHSNSHALLIGGQDIIAKPPSVIDSAPGATNIQQQAFNERQGVLLSANLPVDGSFISAGALINSHMIFVNPPPGVGGVVDLAIDWLFDGAVLGVMSDVGGTLEASSSAFLGPIGTAYPAAFPNRGLESGDSTIVSGNKITVSMSVVNEPGDWIRVITAAAVPEPTTLALLTIGLVGLGVARRREAIRGLR